MPSTCSSATLAILLERTGRQDPHGGARSCAAASHPSAAHLRGGAGVRAGSGHFRARSARANRDRLARGRDWVALARRPTTTGCRETARCLLFIFINAAANRAARTPLIRSGPSGPRCVVPALQCSAGAGADLRARSNAPSTFAAPVCGGLRAGGHRGAGGVETDGATAGSLPASAPLSLPPFSGPATRLPLPSSALLPILAPLPPLAHSWPRGKNIA